MMTTALTKELSVDKTYKDVSKSSVSATSDDDSTEVKSDLVASAALRVDETRILLRPVVEGCDETQLMEKPVGQDREERTQLLDREASSKVGVAVDTMPAGAVLISTPDGGLELGQTSEQTLIQNRFLLDTPLGAGGMGTVYKAQDLRKVEAEDRRPYVAVKILNQDFKQHPQAYVSLQQEAVKSQKLAHPNIVTVYDFDRDGDTIFMTMELLEGSPLDGLLKSVRNVGIAKEDAVDYFLQLCKGLSYAHARNIVHSDFKPGNIFLSSEGTAKILDFGIARAASEADNHSSFDAASLGALTPTYASLEMLLAQPPRFSDDIYALACVFYEMLAGVHPYGRKPADMALEEGLKPGRIKSLSRREWKALEKGLALKQVDRWQEVAEFQKAFTPAFSSKLLLATASIASIGVIAASWAIYNNIQSEAEQVKLLSATFAVAQGCMNEQDYQCTIENTVVILNAAPKNESALRLNKQARKKLVESNNAAHIEKLLTDAKGCFVANQLDCATVKLNELLVLEEDNRFAAQLLQEVSSKGVDNRMREYVGEVGQCLLKNDYLCVDRLLGKATLLAPDHPELLVVKQRVDEQRQRQSTLRKERTKKVKSLLGRAQRCLDRNQFSCAIAESRAALGVDSGNDQAIAIKRSAEVALLNAKSQQKVIDNMLVRADQCFAAKNYSCTISTADAALAIDHEHVRSIALKKKAEEEQLRIKRSISIN